MNRTLNPTNPLTPKTKSPRSLKKRGLYLILNFKNKLNYFYSNSIKDH
jgi:hypothetical protein